MTTFFLAAEPVVPVLINLLLVDKYCQFYPLYYIILGFVDSPPHYVVLKKEKSIFPLRSGFLQSN